jgi:SAM-dependent methyltransferase
VDREDEMTHAGAGYWDDFFSQRDLDWGGRWTEPFLPHLQAAGVRRVLELGCGTGHDAARLARAGFEVVALDLSAEAIAQAQRTYGDLVEFVVADVAQVLPYAPASYDAVMANVSIHMFSDAVTRSLFAEVRRVLRPAGLFVFHVNSIGDRPLREQARPIIREVEPNYVLEQAGQTVRYFSRDYLRELLAEWEILQLDHLEIHHDSTRAPFEKRVWRVIARRPSTGSDWTAPGKPPPC